MSEPKITPDAVNWEIATTGVNVLGNDANRFDAHSQSGTLGPYPPTAETGSPETNGFPGNPPEGT